MTTFYPDVSSAQAGVLFSGAPVAMVKATEGLSYVNPDYYDPVTGIYPAAARAAAAGAYLAAYHFLITGAADDPGMQAGHAYNVIAGHMPQTPLMLDIELDEAGRAPSLADAAAFTDVYRAHGGVLHEWYLPRWFWAGFLGSADLAGVMVPRRLALVSADYTAYSDTGPGWEPYGGMTPAVWQYTAMQFFNGFTVDFNAFRGTAAGLITLMNTGQKETGMIHYKTTDGRTWIWDGSRLTWIASPADEAVTAAVLGAAVALSDAQFAEFERTGQVIL